MRIVSLIIPTLNEGESIRRLLQRLEAVNLGLIKNDFSLEILVVDDGSKDDTGKNVKEYESQTGFMLRLIERNVRGLATAVIDGFKQANGEIFGVIDADLSHPPELIPELVKKANEFDFSVGSRKVNGGGVEDWPWHRRILSQGATIMSFTLGIKVKDPMSGFFFLKREVVEGVELSPIGYKILLEILVKGKYNSVVEVPYIFRNRDVGQSKAGAREGINYLRHLGRLYEWRVSQAIKFKKKE